MAVEIYSGKSYQLGDVVVNPLYVRAHVATKGAVEVFPSGGLESRHVKLEGQYLHFRKTDTTATGIAAISVQFPNMGAAQTLWTRRLATAADTTTNAELGFGETFHDTNDVFAVFRNQHPLRDVYLPPGAQLNFALVGDMGELDVRFIAFEAEGPIHGI